MFNTLGSMKNITISQEAAGKPIIIEYNRTKSELNKGFILLYGHYTKNISANQNTFTATVTATTTNTDGDKANYDGSIQTITRSRNIDVPVEAPARNSLDSSFAIGDDNIYRDHVNQDGNYQSDDPKLTYGPQRRIEIINNGNQTQQDVTTHIDLEPGTVLVKLNNGKYGLLLNSSAINKPKSIVATLEDGRKVNIPINISTFSDGRSIGYAALITSDLVNSGVNADGTNIASLDVTYTSLEPGTKLEISFGNNGLISDKKPGEVATYSYTVTSANGASHNGVQSIPIADPKGFQYQFTGWINFTGGDYQPNSENGGNLAKVSYTLQHVSYSDEASSYLIEIPRGFTVNPSNLHLFQKNKEAEGGKIEYLGTVGEHREQTFIISLPFMPYYGIPVYVKDANNQDLTMTATPNQAPANYSYAPTLVDTNPLIAEIVTDENKFTPVSFQAFHTITRGKYTFTILNIPGFGPNWVKYSFSYASTYSSFDSIRSNGDYVQAGDSLTNPPKLNYIQNGQVDNTSGSFKLNTYLSDLGQSDYSYNLVNLPDVTLGDNATISLTGPGTISENKNGENVQLLYSTKHINKTEALTEDNFKDFVTADKVTDWSVIKSVLLKAGTLTSPGNITAELPFKVTEMKDGEINTNVVFNTNFTGFHNAITHSNPQLALNVQRYINVTTKWVDDDTDQELAPSTTQMVRSGDIYQTIAKPADLNPNYRLERVEGKQYGVTGANDLIVTYHYKALTDDSLKESKSITRTINYVVNDGQVQAPDTVVQAVTLIRHGSKNLVTGNITWGQWSDDQWNEVVSKTVKGYHPDKESVAQQKVTINTDDATVIVHYIKNPVETTTENKVVKRTIIYVVKDNGVKAPETVKQEFKFSREVFTDTVTGDVTFGNWNFDHSSFDAVVSPALKGYTPDIESVDALTVTPDSKDIDVTVTYAKNPIKTSTEDKVVKRTIIYVVKDNGVKAPETVKQEFKFSREVFTDTVTGDVTYGNWNVDNTSFEAVDSPSLKGYTPDLKSVTALSVTPDTKDTVVTVTYTKNPVVTSTESKTVKRTINYLIDGNEVSAPDSVNQEFTFSRDVFTDTVTGDVTYGNWNVDNTSFVAVDSPSLKGYTPDLKSVTALSVTPDTKDTVITVTYTKNPVEVQPTPKPAEPVDSNKPSPTEPTNIVTKQVNPTSVTAKSQTPNQVVPSQQATTSKELPQTGEDHNSLTTIGLLMLSLATGLGLKKRKKD
ncbi:mucin-binding protein [Ligilactobacillus salivarius]|uniref:mucin-binding protein n=5 Tax=Ligilactobacillus salivarius TaxID=1624 RepID=UPI00321B1162